MNDQAESLRLRVKNQSDNISSKVISVISGKGGVGKSNFALNFSISLCSEDHNVLLFDLDVGMGNIDILMGSTSEKTIVDVFEGDIPVSDVIRKGPNNLSFIAGGTGLAKAVQFDEDKFDKFQEQFERLQLDYKYIIFDMGAGVNNIYLKWLLSSSEIFVITTPEPTAIMDAYSAIKYLSIHDNKIPTHLILNRSSEEKNNLEVLYRLKDAADKFLDKELKVLGSIPDDHAVGISVLHQVPFVIYSPKSKASVAIRQIAKNYLAIEQTNNESVEQKKSFIGRLRKLLFER